MQVWNDRGPLFRTHHRGKGGTGTLGENKSHHGMAYS
jgi:hypothetical protein